MNIKLRFIIFSKLVSSFLIGHFPYLFSPFLRVVYRRKDKYAIVFDGAQAIYVPIPKVATSAIYKFFAKIEGVEIYESKDDPGKPMMVHQANFKKIEIDSISRKHKSYLKFSFVRNPYDRLYSCYLDKIKGKKYIYPGMKISNSNFYPDMPFKEFVFLVCNTPDDVSDKHFRSQASFIYDDFDVCLVDYVGRQESMDGDFLVLLKKLGMEDSVLPRINRKTPSNQSSGVYDPDMVAMMKVRYQRDFRLFGYSENPD